MEKQEKITHALTLLKAVNQDIAKRVQRFLDVADAVRQRSERIKASMPYHINLIDELYINENGHSRILTKLLQYRNSKGDYEILQSFIDFAVSKNTCDGWDIQIKKPIITQEKDRIDLWVRDEDYALIFENKVYNATDQDAQLYRYIKKTKENGYKEYKEEQIYLFYLPQYQHTPDDRTWGNADTKERFKSRFAILSFRDYILPWLKNEILPNIRQRDHQLLHAVAQYVDYLNGLFNLRETDKPLNMELQSIIATQLGLDTNASPKEKINELDKALTDLNELQSQMQVMRNLAYQELQKQYVEKWKGEYACPSSFEFCKYTENADSIGFGVKFTYDGKETHIFIGYNGRLYCQIEYNCELSNEERNIENSSLLPIVRPKLSEENWWCIWRYFNAMDFDGVYACFKEVIEIVDAHLTTKA